jgi:hypothetical protein
MTILRRWKGFASCQSDIERDLIGARHGGSLSMSLKIGGAGNPTGVK